MMTVMSIVAERSGIPLAGSHFSVKKEMNQSPRRIGTLAVEIHMPAQLTEDQRTKLENAAHTCPVHHSLHDSVKMPLTFLYDV